VANIARDVVD